VVEAVAADLVVTNPDQVEGLELEEDPDLEAQVETQEVQAETTEAQVETQEVLVEITVDLVVVLEKEFNLMQPRLFVRT
jgi:hypothetical protein